MIHKTTTLAYCFLSGVIPAALGFSSDGSLLTRSFDKTIALTNSSILVTANFTNGGAGELRGFYYGDQMPAGLDVSTLSVMLNGWAITNYTFESGQEGDVYAGCIPYRWVLERPAGLTETNPIPPQTGVQIVYSIRSLTPGTFNLQQFSWAGYDPGSTNFGHSEDVDQQSLTFTATTNTAILLTGQYLTSTFVLWLTGQPGSNYVIEASPDLFDWTPLLTNTSPFDFADTNTASFSNRFYRAKSFY